MIGPGTVPTWTDAAPVVGSEERMEGGARAQREQAVAFSLAARLVRSHFAVAPGDDSGRRIRGRGSFPPWSGSAGSGSTRPWWSSLASTSGSCLGTPSGRLGRRMRCTPPSMAGRQPAATPPADAAAGYDPIGSTERVDFQTRKVALRDRPNVARSATSCWTARTGQHLGAVC